MNFAQRAQHWPKPSLMADHPPLYKQETPYSCGPACLRMVLDFCGIAKTEAEVRLLCDCTFFGGTDAHLLVEAARTLGFVKTRKYSMGFADLRRELERGMFPFVYVRTRLSEHGSPQLH